MKLDSLQPILEEYGQNLPEMPKWIGLVDHTGKMICSIGNFDVLVTDNRPSDKELAMQIHVLAENNYKALDTLQLGNYQASIHIGGRGMLFVLNLDDRFALAVSYHGIGDGCCISDLDKTEEAIRNFSGIIMEAIYL